MCLPMILSLNSNYWNSFPLCFFSASFGHSYPSTNRNFAYGTIITELGSWEIFNSSLWFKNRFSSQVPEAWRRISNTEKKSIKKAFIFIFKIRAIRILLYCTFHITLKWRWRPTDTHMQSEKMVN